LVRRITGKSLGTFFREEVAVPLGVDFHIGFSAEHDYRVSEMIPPPILQPGEPGYMEMDPNSMLMKAFTNPAINYEMVNERAYRGAEIPAINGHGNARAIARVGAAMACGGELEGVRLMGLPTIEKAIEEQIYDTDLIISMPVRYGLGFGLNSEELPLSPNPHAFFWAGMGGSFVLMDLDARLSWSYVMNKMGPNPLMDMRGIGIAQTLYASLA
jgi:CubicO group peptidase (beta-lactamase class C family)